MFRRFVALLTLISLLFAWMPLHAEEKLRSTVAPTVTASAQPIPPPLIVVLKKGQLAPWDGVLLNSTATAQITVDKENSKKECDITVKSEVDKQKAFDTVKLADKESELKYTRDTLTAQVKSRDAELDAMRKRSASSSGDWVLWMSLGAAGGIVLTVGAVFLVSYVKNN